MPDPDIPLVALRGAQRAYDRARGTDYSALVDRKTQSSSVRPPPLTEGQLAGLERLENDYQNLRDAEFTKRYGRSRIDYWKVRDLLVNLRNQHLRAQEDAIRIAEEVHGKIDNDRQWQAEQDFSSLNRAVEAVRSSPLAAAFLLYANTHGGSLKQQADAAELGQATAALGGALTVAGSAIGRRQESQQYKGSAGLTLGLVEHRPSGGAATVQGMPAARPKAKIEAPASPQTTENKGQQPRILDFDRKITDENRGLVSAEDTASGRSAQPLHSPRTPTSPSAGLPVRTGIRAGSSMGGGAGPGTARAPATPTLVGTDEASFRRDANRAIRRDPNHPLRFLVGNNGDFKQTRGLTHAELADRNDLVQMGHVKSNKSGGTQVVLQDAWMNQFDNITVEHRRNMGSFVESREAIDIGGIGVERNTAMMWEREGLIPAGTVANARRIDNQ